MEAYLWTAFWAAVIIGSYILPALIAFLRKHPNAFAIGMLNGFLGWTIIGWFAALIWAVTAIDDSKRYRQV